MSCCYHLFFFNKERDLPQELSPEQDFISGLTHEIQQKKREKGERIIIIFVCVFLFFQVGLFFTATDVFVDQRLLGWTFPTLRSVGTSETSRKKTG